MIDYIILSFYHPLTWSFSTGGTGIKGFRETLENDTRYRISIDDYKKMAGDAGVTEQELLQLEQENVVIRIPTLDKFVFIHPNRVTAHLQSVLDPTNEITQQKIAQNHLKLQELLKTKKQMDHLQLQVKESAERSTNRALWTVAGGGAATGVLIGRLTWWDLSWDIMEPCTYLLTFGSSVIFLAYFQAARLDFSYAALGERMHQKRLKKFNQKLNFNVEEYNTLCKSIDHVQQELLVLGAPPLPSE